MIINVLSSILNSLLKNKQVESPKVESPKVESPKVESPKVESPKVSSTKELLVEKSSSPKSEVVSNPKKEISISLSDDIETCFTNLDFEKLRDVDLNQAALLLDCEEAAIRAVVEVESSGGGFLPSKKPKILFEAHLFARATKNKYNNSHPEISSESWNRSLYKGGEKEYARLKVAYQLDKKAALSSCSYGMFQILGSNYQSCGFTSLEDFVIAQIKSEKEQLRCFIGFVKTNKLDAHLKSLNFAMFAKGYNGPSYRQNKYDEKLLASYNKWKQVINK